jgi:hypothetical protein
MLTHRGRNSAGARRRIRVTTVALAVPLAVLVSASPAMAERVFEKFQHCPTEVEGVSLCSFARTTSGEFAIGSTKVPINRTITLQGGGIKTGNPGQPQEYALIPPKKPAEALSKTALNVPGGLLDLVKCTDITGEGLLEKAARAVCKLTFETGATEVTATTELVANKSNPVLLNLHNLAEEEETAVTLPIRVHLKNAFLGNQCYIGSEASPIELRLTTGTSGTLKGKRGHVETLEEVVEGKELLSLRITENSLVDGLFKVPVVEGCGELLLVTGYLDSIIDAKLGLPSESGKNAANLEGELNSAGASEVIESGF